MPLDDAELKQRQRTMWATGRYPDIATTIESVSPIVVDAVGVAAGEELLDVATGTGNAALAAARKGARVTGLDLTPELIEVARARTAAEGLTIRYVEGDAESLPFEDERFDRVTSVFGAMFAPDQERTAGELLRVCRPGGTIAFAAWTSEGLNGRMFATVGRHVPPPPPGARSPMEWGSEDRVRQLLPDAELTFERLGARDSVHAPSPEAWVDYLEEVLGPLVLAKRGLEAEGRWQAARDDLIALYAEGNEAEDGTMLAHPEYLLTVARKAG